MKGLDIPQLKGHDRAGSVAELAIWRPWEAQSCQSDAVPTSAPDEAALVMPGLARVASCWSIVSRTSWVTSSPARAICTQRRHLLAPDCHRETHGGRRSR